MVTIPVFDAQGNRVREVELDPDIVDDAVRAPLLKESLLAWLASQRQGSHSTKTRSEVAGGGAKPWRQKGTGRARQGTTRAAQWVGGGRAHGPKPRDYAYRLPRKQRRLAVRSLIRLRLEEGHCCAIEGLEGLFAEKPRTRAMAACLATMGLAGKGALVVCEDHQPNLQLALRNLPKVDLVERRNLNAGQALQKPNLIFTLAALDALSKELSA